MEVWVVILEDSVTVLAARKGSLQADRELQLIPLMNCSSSNRGKNSGNVLLTDHRLSDDEVEEVLRAVHVTRKVRECFKSTVDAAFNAIEEAYA